MATTYTDVDRLILQRWDEVSELIAARDELQDKIDDVVESAGERLRRWLEPQGYTLEVHARDAAFHFYRSAWAVRKRGPSVYFVLGGFCPRGYRRCADAHPYLWLYTDTLENFRIRPEERRAFAADVRRELGSAAGEWTDDDCEDDGAPIGLYLRDVDPKARGELVSSPEELYEFAVREIPKILVHADIVEGAVDRVLRRQ